VLRGVLHACDPAWEEEGGGGEARGMRRGVKTEKDGTGAFWGKERGKGCLENSGEGWDGMGRDWQ
jgi:hypothetical protein